MLVMYRRKNESLFIGTAIKVTVVEVRAGKVRLGIECPRDLPVHREELWQQLRELPMSPSDFAAFANQTFVAEGLRVLSRQPRESIVFGGGTASILVVSLENDRVRLGVEAPRDIILRRAESE